MRHNNYFFERVSNYSILLLIVFMCFIKLVFMISIQTGFLELSFGGGSDANYYHSYAEGYTNSAVNSWPIILRYLNNIGLYSRDLISYLLFFLNIIVIPLMTVKISGITLKGNQKYYFYALLICLMYPTLLFYSTDVYRDVFMVFVFLVGCVIVKKCLSSSNIIMVLLLFASSVLIGFILLGLRPYLGYAFLLSLLLWPISFNKKRIIFFGILYFLMLFLANYIGLLDELTEYRAGFEDGGGGSTLGLDFSNPIMFIPNFILSVLGQLFGLYITNPLAAALFLIESIPFLFMFVYVIKNIKLADKFVRFLIIFFVLYGSVWLIGNDNLGTALRLRLYNYFAIYICFFYILRLKSLSIKKGY